MLSPATGQDPPDSKRKHETKIKHFSIDSNDNYRVNWPTRAVAHTSGLGGLFLLLATPTHSLQPLLGLVSLHTWRPMSLAWEPRRQLLLLKKWWSPWPCTVCLPVFRCHCCSLWGTTALLAVILSFSCWRFTGKQQSLCLLRSSGNGLSALLPELRSLCYHDCAVSKCSWPLWPACSGDLGFSLTNEPANQF